mgnify:CR=1 FL=1
MIFFRKSKFPFRCNYCGCKVKVPLQDVLQLENENKDDSVCPLKIECHYCHMGYVIPSNYKSKNGKTYKFDELYNKVPTLDPNTFFDRLLDEDNF